jgi:hypothetical protein
VDNHWVRIFSGALLTSLFAAGIEISQGQNSSVLTQPSYGQQIFIDINTKQRPVPNELLLDIKKLAEYQSEVESLLGEVFDHFNENQKSALLGLMSPHRMQHSA